MLFLKDETTKSLSPFINHCINIFYIFIDYKKKTQKSYLMYIFQHFPFIHA